MASAEGSQGYQRRFSGDSLDPKEYRRWKLWVEAKMASTKDMGTKQRGPYVFCLLDGVALEAVEHLTLEALTESNGDNHIWTALDARFPDKLTHDWLAECLKEVFELSATDGESLASWTSRVQEAFSKCKRKVAVDFPPEARGWVVLNASGLSPDQRAIVTAKTQGDLRFDVVVASMRSCFPEFKASRKTGRSSSAFLVHRDEGDEPDAETVLEPDLEGPDAVQFDEVEAFLAEHGLGDQSGAGEAFEEEEIAEVLAATWKERRTEISRLQKSRKFGQANSVKRQFSRELTDLQKKSRCRKCGQIGHWARHCTQKSSSSSSGKTDKDKTHGAAVVEDVLLVSSPGYGILDSGCSRTLVGQETLNAFMRLYQERNMSCPPTREQHNLFRFGNGQEEWSERVVSMPVCIHGKVGRIEAAIIRGSAPLLLSRNTLKSLQAVLDFSQGTLSIEGSEPRPLQTNSAGQFVLNVLDSEETLLCDQEDAENESETDSEGDETADEGLASGTFREFTKREHRCLLAHHEAWQKGRSTCAVAELFSPPRFSEVLGERGEHGLSFDIKQGWDLTKPQVQKQVDSMLERQKPELLVCCPECKHWGGWYRLNKSKLPLTQQLINQRRARAQADFCAEQIRKQLKRGGRVLVEHPWSSDIWRHPPIQKLLKTGALQLQKANMCAYGLQDGENSKPILKPTGLAVSHPDMIELAKQCPGHVEHQSLEGHLSNGQSRSALAATYTRDFVLTWLLCIRPEWQLCNFACLQEPPMKPTERKSNAWVEVHEICAAQEVREIEPVLRRLHQNLGHPSTRTLVRILRNAGATEQAIKSAEHIETSCDICQQRKRPTPCLPTSPEKFQDFNHRIGWDVKVLPGWQVNQQVKCVNIIDYATSFQVMVPFYEKETAAVLKRIFLEHWHRWAGPPVEVIVDPARTNTAESVFHQLEQEGIRVISIAAEAHNQLGKVEKHGHLFEVILQKVLDQTQPQNKEEYEQCVVQTSSAKNELLNQKGLSPYQLVFGRNPRVPADLVQEWPCPVAGTTPLHDESAERARVIRSQARVALVLSQDDTSLRAALNARPRVDRDFLPGDYVSYWRTQKYEKGVRLVGGRWYGVAIVMGRVGRNYLVYHRKNMFKVAPEHLRPATQEERMLAQTDGREMLGLSSLMNEETCARLGAQFTDLTGTPTPEQSRRTLEPVEDFWLRRGDLMIRVHRNARLETFWPSETDPAIQGLSLENWRKTIRSDTKECIVHQPLSQPESQETKCWDSVWKGESQFRIKPKREMPSQPQSQPRVGSQPRPGVTPGADAQPEADSTPGDEPAAVKSAKPEPYARPETKTAEPGPSTEYGPIRVRSHGKGPQAFWIRPPETKIDDLQEILTENHGVKRSHSPEKSSESGNKSQKVEEDMGDSCLLAELADEYGPAESFEILVASFLQKKMQKELHHSNNPEHLQEKIDLSKTTEWTTLRDEKKALKVIPPKESQWIRTHKANRIMTSRFVIIEKHEDGDSKIKARWCLRGHHDSDLFQKVLAGKCHSPTLSQFGRSLILQLLVSNKWKMCLGDIKGAFLEADVRQKALENPVYAELPPGGVPGVEKGSLVQVLGNIYGANDAPHEWYCEFDKQAISAGFVRSKFDSCLYLCFEASGRLEGILGAHVDDTITGGDGPKYNRAIEQLRSRFPFRKWRSGTGEFLGTVYTQDLDSFEISYQQKEYAEHIQPIKIQKDRAKKHWLPANPQEIAALRAVNGALSWLSTQSRPDLAVQTSMSQQCFPQPTIFDLLQANQAVRRARQQSDLTIKVPFIPLKELTLCFWSDAAFANSAELKTQGGWIVAFTSTQMRSGMDVPIHCFSWKSYRLPRVVSSTMGGESGYASGFC